MAYPLLRTESPFPPTTSLSRRRASCCTSKTLSVQDGLVQLAPRMLTLKNRIFQVEIEKEMAKLQFSSYTSTTTDFPIKPPSRAPFLLSRRRWAHSRNNLVWILGVRCWIHQHRTRMLYGPVALWEERQEAAKLPRLLRHQRRVLHDRRIYDPRKLPHLPPRRLLRG